MNLVTKIVASALLVTVSAVVYNKIKDTDYIVSIKKEKVVK